MEKTYNPTRADLTLPGNLFSNSILTLFILNDMKVELVLLSLADNHAITFFQSHSRN
jgi:hypothetical protein